MFWRIAAAPDAKFFAVGGQEGPKFDYFPFQLIVMDGLRHEWPIAITWHTTLKGAEKGPNQEAL